MSNKSETRSGSTKANLSNLFGLVVMGTIISLAGFSQQTVAQNTELPMTIHWSDSETFFLDVPDKDVSRPAYGGKLKLYDVHVAKMFEVTQHLCQTEPQRTGYNWIYDKNGGGRTRIGTFEISCDLANDIAIAYGSGKAETTTVECSRGGRACPSKTYSIPILNITGGKVNSWIQFMSKFKPV